MRILAITPIRVGDEELARRQARYDRLAPLGMKIQLDNLVDSSSVPRALETTEQIKVSEALLAEQFGAADPLSYDALLPDCVLDPVVGTETDLPLPLHGLSRLTSHHLAGLGHRVGAVARNAAIAAELDRKLATYAITLDMPTVVLDLSFEAIAADSVWARAVARALEPYSCEVVINACSAVEVSPGAAGPRVVDPTRTALQVLAVAAGLTSGEGAR